MNITLDKITKYILYSLVFLFPLFFLPWTVSPLAFNKQTLLAVFVLLMVALWLIKTMSVGKVRLKADKMSKCIILLLMVSGLSFAFSGSKTQSFWGSSMAEPDTFFNFILYGLLFFLVANLLKREEVAKTVTIFLVSGGLLTLLYLINFLVKIFPWDFTRVSGFNPIGSSQALAVYLGGLFVVLIATVSCRQLRETTVFGKPVSKRIIRGLIVILGILLFISLFLINYWVAWLGIVFGSTIVILGKLYTFSSAPQNILKNFWLPLVIILLSLVFIFIRLPFGNTLDIPPEVSPTYKATFDIAAKTLKEESPKNIFLGSGPATFGFQYSLHRPALLNLTDFWQARFNQGVAALPTFLATLGVFGVLAILLMMVIFVWQGLKLLINQKQDNWAINMVVFAGGFYFLLSWFFYSANFSLMTTAFLMMGLWAATVSTPSREVSFSQTPQKTFFIMLLGILLLAGVVIGIYTVGQKYVAAVNYAQGLNLFNQEAKLDEAITKVNRAASLDRKDAYFRTLSQLFLVKINEILRNQTLAQGEKQNLLQQNISAAETSATEATKINPKDSYNWLQLGSVYENTIALIEGANQLAVQHYQKAANLDPNNPEIFLSLGRIYFSDASKVQQSITFLEMAEKKDEEKLKELQEVFTQSSDLALQKFQESRNLKTNYGPAYYWLARVYELQDKDSLALENYRIFLRFEPENAEAKAKVKVLEESLQEELK